ncbi:tumor necrosis factor ligand superfamily member 14 [Hoplias malabaricus]|uniref:tumor necrosis factor ligand superfamily member 14 n=1 Tax=Hoplias malabaricus TaxID=27720 RepID=UPI003461EAE6
MEQGPVGCPQVFIVDSQAPVNLSPIRDTHTVNKKMYVLYLLVGLALLGISIEAVLIYRLYQRDEQASGNAAHADRIIGTKHDWGSDGDANGIHPIRDKKPDLKPAALLQGVSKLHEDGVIEWNTEGLGPFIHGLKYEKGSLHVQMEGYYFIYSKVYFSETCTLFKHQIKRRSPRYNNSPTDLMQSFRYSCVGSPRQQQQQDRADVGNSFLGGVFLLYSGDSVFVQVNDSKLIRPGIYDNNFGVFMI